MVALCYWWIIYLVKWGDREKLNCSSIFILYVLIASRNWMIVWYNESFFFFLQFYYRFVRIYFSFNWNTGWIISLVAKNLKYIKNSKISGCKIKFYLLNSRISFALSPFPSISLTNNLITKDWTNHTRACAIFDQYNTGLKKSCTRESKTQEMNGIFFSPFLSILFFPKIYPTRVIFAQEWLNF